MQTRPSNRGIGVAATCTQDFKWNQDLQPLTGQVHSPPFTFRKRGVCEIYPSGWCLWNPSFWTFLLPGMVHFEARRWAGSTRWLQGRSPGAMLFLAWTLCSSVFCVNRVLSVAKMHSYQQESRFLDFLLAGNGGLLFHRFLIHAIRPQCGGAFGKPQWLVFGENTIYRYRDLLACPFHEWPVETRENGQRALANTFLLLKYFTSHRVRFACQRAH